MYVEEFAFWQIILVFAYGKYRTHLEHAKSQEHARRRVPIPTPSTYPPPHQPLFWYCVC